MDSDRDSGIDTPTQDRDQQQSREDPKHSTGNDKKEWSKFVVFRVGPEREKMMGLKTKLLIRSQAFDELVCSENEIELPQYSAAVFEIFLKVSVYNY
jgi:hypothetical protein